MINKLTNGSIIVHWDDDDYYNENRLYDQVLPIINNNAEITLFENFLQLHLDKKSNTFLFYQVKFPCYWQSHFGTLMYKKSVWKKTKFLPFSLSEDYGFASDAALKGDRIKVIPNYNGTFIYVRHGTNTWNLPQTRPLYYRYFNYFILFFLFCIIFITIKAIRELGLVIIDYTT